MGIMWFIIVLYLFNTASFSNGGITSTYVRKSEPSMDMPVNAFPPPMGYKAPEQVDITQGDHVGRSVIVSWVTPVERFPNVVTYWAAEGKHKHKHRTRAITMSYKYYNYTSGYIHHAIIKQLEVN